MLLYALIALVVPGGLFIAGYLYYHDHHKQPPVVVPKPAPKVIIIEKPSPPKIIIKKEKAKPIIIHQCPPINFIP